MTSWPPATTWTTRPRFSSATCSTGTPSTWGASGPLAERIGRAVRLRVSPRPTVKPLVRLTERETAAYCVLRGIDYIVEECPMAEGNRHPATRRRSTPRGRIAGGETGLLLRVPGRAAAVRFAPDADGADGELEPACRCGPPTTGEVCALPPPRRPGGEAIGGRPAQCRPGAAVGPDAGRPGRRPAREPTVRRRRRGAAGRRQEAPLPGDVGQRGSSTPTPA